MTTNSDAAKSAGKRELRFIAPEAHILVVDDNEINRKIMKGLLEPTQIQIDTVCNGREAVELVRKNRYDLVFMDYIMPVMDGIEAAKKIRSLDDDYYRNLPVVAMSSNEPRRTRKLVLGEELDDFVSKPFALGEVLQCILKWLPAGLVTIIDPDRETEGMILIVDDDEITIKAVTEMLQDQYIVLGARSGHEAFALLDRNVPDLILLDVYMPDLDGHAVITRLKGNERYKDIPVIFLTSDANENTEVQALREGAIDYIRKPLRRDVALQRIRRILELSYLEKNLQKEVEKQTKVAEERRRKMEKVSWQMVHALANTIDAKDANTNGHSTRVAEYAVMIARRMGYTGEKLEQLQYAALLHDIGKIGIPSKIINKPSFLTDEEFDIIKTHPAIGANILREISEIPEIEVGARWHHERYDGKGYPDHIRGEEIPEIARIIGVADAYDAMTSKRSYKDILPQNVVCRELREGKGSQFDPEIAEIMLEIMKEDTDYNLREKE